MARKIISATKLRKGQETEFYFKINFPAFMQEVVQNALPRNSGVLKVPLQIFMNYMENVAKRCQQLNDPVLNRLMVDMALYEEADPYSPEYKTERAKKMRAIVAREYKKFMKTKKARV